MLWFFLLAAVLIYIISEKNLHQEQGYLDSHKLSGQVLTYPYMYSTQGYTEKEIFRINK